MKLLKLLTKYFFAILLILQNATSMVSSEDSSKIFYMKPHIITATRSLIPADESPNFVELITQDQLSRTNALTIGEVLSYKSGIYVKEYGSAGSLKTISLRGTSPENTLFLINGSRINNFQNGLVDLSLIPVETIERIEIVHGGSSALYGTDAIGGIINILTTQPTEKLKLKMNWSKGSFGFNKYLIGISNKIYDIGFNLSYLNESSKDNYTYTVKDTARTLIKERENSRYKRNQIYLSLFYSLDRTNIALTSGYIDAKRGVPGSVSYTSSTANQSDKNFSSQVQVSNSSIENLNIKILSSMFYGYQKYDDPSYGYNSFSKNIHYNFNPNVEFNLNKNIKIIGGIEFTQGKLNGVDYASKVIRTQKSLYLSSNIKNDYDNTIFNSVMVYPAIRYDKFSNQRGEFAPKIGINTLLFNQIHLRGSYGSNYRIPTLNDLYYQDSWGSVGNPQLKPEYSKTYDVGVSTLREFAGKFTFDISYFSISTRDKIIWVPTSVWTYSPKNVGKVVLNGFTGKLEWNIKNLVAFEISHSITNARKLNSEGANDPTYNKQLIYSPKEQTKVGISLNYQFISLNLNQIFIGKRFTDEANTKSLPSYSLIDVNLVLERPILSVNFRTKFEVNNISNIDYQNIADYPMPLRSYRFTLGIEL